MSEWAKTHKVPGMPRSQVEEIFASRLVSLRPGDGINIRRCSALWTPVACTVLPWLLACHSDLFSCPISIVPIGLQRGGGVATFGGHCLGACGLFLRLPRRRPPDFTRL